MTPLDPGGFWSYSAPRPMALGENGPIGMTKSARLDFVRPAGNMHKSDGETSTQDETVRDVLLVALTVASGAVDAISYFGLGKIFSAFMTGNIVFLGFGIAEIEGPDVIPVIFALSMFAAGSYVGLRITTLRSKESGPWPPAMTVLLILVAIAESRFSSRVVGNDRTSARRTVADVLIALFSLAMGIQTAAVRSLGVQGVFTTAGTFTLVAFAGTFAGSRSKAEIPRLAGVFVGLVAGAVGGRTALPARAQLRARCCRS